MNRKEYNKKYYKEHRNEMAEYDKKYQQNHRDRIAEYQKKYREEHRNEILAHYKEHRDEILAHRKQYYKEHRDEKLAYYKQWYEQNKKKHKQQIKAWRENHIEQYRERVRKSKFKRRKLGFVPLNKPFKESEAHHICLTFVIYMPKNMHRSIYHSIWTGKNMVLINNLAFDYLLETKILQGGER